MQLTVSNHSFEILSLEGTLALAHHLGFRGVDIAGFHNRGRCSLEPAEVAANPQEHADNLLALLEKYGLHAVDFFPQFGASPSESSINDPDPAIWEQDAEWIRGAARFCKAANIPGMTILPGVDHPNRTLEQNLEASGEVLKKATEIAAEYDVELRFEPHMGSVAETPERALTLIEMAPNAKITLDYSHFVLQYIPEERIHAMIPYTGHVHVRPSRPGKLQSAYSENTIDWVDIINRLKATNYDGALSVEYVYADWFDLNRNDILTETVFTKEALEAHVSI